MTGKIRRSSFSSKYLLLGVITLVVVLVDQWTKLAIHRRFHWGESRPLFESFFSLTYVRNTGAAFGLLHHAPVWFREPFFIVVPVAAMFVILWIFATLPKSQKTVAFGLCLVFSGALGNLIDRLRLGYVIDFLDFYWKQEHWPAFNFADSCIVVGVTILFVATFMTEASERTKKVSKETRPNHRIRRAKSASKHR